MWLKAFDTREAVEVGSSLADQFVAATREQEGRNKGKRVGRQGNDPQAFLERVDREARPLQLGVFRRAKLASTFKWRLLDNGVDPQLVDELTRALLLRLSTDQTPPISGISEGAVTAGSANAVGTQSTPNQVQALVARADKLMAQSAHAEVAQCYRELLAIQPEDFRARNNFGVALWKLGRCQEAEQQFRQSISIRATNADAQFNLGSLLRVMGRVDESELPLRRALKLNPKHIEALVSLGHTLAQLNRLRDAQDCFEKALKTAPRHAGATYGLGWAASLEGHFEEAEALFKRALTFEAKMPIAWAALAGLRKMTRADAAWLKGAEEIAGSELPPLEEADLRFAIGKYYDDTGDFDRAFRSHKRANDLMKNAAQPYDAQARTRFVDAMIRVYSRESFSEYREGYSDSVRPVFVVGMMRSGTSLVEQIIASHPAARGAGELSFWNDAARKHQDVLRQHWVGEALGRKLAKGYLQKLAHCSADALRIVDKAPVNSDHLGLIRSIFPNARVIYVRRDPIDTCLSCYFQQFSVDLNFTLDLTDLAHYYREHRRLMDHWRAVLPAGTLLDVPYEELVTDQEKWTRRMLEFLGLEWDERCLEFHKTERPVATASFWQVRQKIYNGSGRARKYEKFIGPLLALRDLRV